MELPYGISIICLAFSPQAGIHEGLNTSKSIKMDGVIPTEVEGSKSNGSNFSAYMTDNSKTKKYKKVSSYIFL